MKVWFSHGTEHSANLSIIGKFKDAETADEVYNIIDALKKHALGYPESLEEGKKRLKATEDLFYELHVRPDPHELRQYKMYDFLNKEGNEVTVMTEGDVLPAIISLFLNRKGKVEILDPADHEDE